MNFIDRLKSYMNENNLKQIDISNKTGMSRGSISNILSGKRVPNEKLLAVLSELSGKSINWWLYGTEKRDNLAALNELIDLFISNNDIKEDGTYDKDIESILHTMLDKEIKVKLQNKKGVASCYVSFFLLFQKDICQLHSPTTISPMLSALLIKILYHMRTLVCNL